jgi:dTDP-4-dehydrorhamnose reductase
MKILVTGANGLLGQHLVKLLLEQTNDTIIATGKGVSRLPFTAANHLHYFPLDITDAVTATDFYLQQQPDVIVHAAALTQVDEGELNKVKCWDINVTATRFLIEAAKQFNPYFIFVSTDFVFDGEKGNYAEEAIAEPVNYYGSSKRAAEKAVLESGLHNAIVRTCLVYGNILQGNRSNIISWVKENLQQGKKIKVVTDQWRTPTYVKDLAKGILQLIEKRATGIFHISGEELMTPYDIATAVAAHLKLNTSLIEKADAATFTQPAQRPAKTGFIIDKAKKELGYQPVSFMEGLRSTLE